MIGAALTACAGSGIPPQLSARAQIVGPEIQSLLVEQAIPGLAIAVVEDARVVQVATFGLRDVEKRLPLTPQTVMAGMSWTKFLFAAYVAELAAEGRIDLDRPIAEYLKRPLPDYPQYRDLSGDTRWRALTLRRLLSHQSGLPNFRWFPPNSDMDRDAPLAFFRDPGVAYGYSGEGFQIAQLTVEEALGIDVAADIEQRFFERPGLQRIGLSWKEHFGTDSDSAYTADGSRLGHDERPRFDAAGSMNTSIADFAALAAAFLRGKIISREARQILLSPPGADSLGAPVPALVGRTQSEACGGRARGRSGCRSLAGATGAWLLQGRS